MRILRDVLRKNRLAIIFFIVIQLLNVAIFCLYDIMTEALVYSIIVTGVLLLVLLTLEYLHAKKDAEERRQAVAATLNNWNHLPEARTLGEADYQEMIEILGRELDRLRTETDRDRQDMLDYYTVWVHQIKTPIAVMKLKLAADTPENRSLSSELFRIEQYVDMVLQYIRLGSSTNDLVISEYDLDELIRETIRKYAGQFIEKRLSLSYEKTDEKIVTDKKWFCCILDQLISNAIKYTSEGGITISVEDSKLRISDTGIGIAPEDLPRIFDKGYTGLNGRIGEKSSGLGLYLVKKAADMLSLSVSAESKPGEGSTFVVRTVLGGNCE